MATSISDKGSNAAWSGVIFQGNDGRIYGDSITLTTDVEVPEGKTLTVRSGETLNLDSNVTMTNRGRITVENGGTFYSSSGVFHNFGTLDGGGTKPGGGDYNEKTSAVTLTASSISPIYGDTITLTAQIVEVATNALRRSVSAKTVVFYCDGIKIGQTTTSGSAGAYQATLTITLESSVWKPGSHALTASYTGGDGQLLPASGEIMLTVKKADQAAPGAPVKSGATANSITLDAMDGGYGEAQYGYQSGGETGPHHWQATPEFTGLEQATAYQFYTRFAGDDYYNEALSPSGTKLYTAAATPETKEGYSINCYTGIITVNSGYEVNTSERFDGEPIVSGSAVAPRAALHIRKAADGSIPASGTMALAVPDRGSIPTVKIDYTDESLSIAADGSRQYSNDNGRNWTDCAGNMVVKDLGWTGAAMAVQFRTEASNEAFASPVRSVTIPARSAAPGGIQGVNETLTGEQDGQITGTSTLMEYSSNNGASWTSCSDTPITSLAPGNYHVRLKATVAAFASVAANVEIATGAERTYTLNVTAPSFEPVTVGYAIQPEAKAISISSTGNSSATVSSVALGGTNAGSFTLNKTDGTTILAGHTDSATYTVRPASGLAVGTYAATITVTYDNSATAMGTVTFTVKRAAQAAPAAPTLDKKTYNSVTLKEIVPNGNDAAAQYSRDGGETWQDSREFTGLGSGTAYTFTARYAETANFEASPSSEPLSVTTDTPSWSGGPTYNKPSVRVDGVGGKVSIGNGTVTILPDEGYQIGKVTVNGNEVKVPETGKLTGLKRTDKVVVAFEKIQAEAPDVLASFTDLKPGAWYTDAVRYVVEHSLFTGTSDTTFSPDAAMARGMLVTVLYRAAGEPDLEDQILCYPFADVDAESWYGAAVYWARLNGIASGTGEETFSPDGPITREQLAVMLYRYSGSPTVTGTLDGFSDAADAGSYATNALSWAVEQGIITGKGNGIVDPRGKATRAEVAAMLMRYMIGIRQ